MTRLMNTAAFASVVAIAAAPAIAQDTTAPTPSADPFVSTQTGEGAGLSGLAVGGLTLVVIGGVIALVDSDGNVVSTTAAP